MPIRPKNFETARSRRSASYPNTPGNNGGISLGLAFLSDIQVYMFMEAAQGDRRVNVMQAPKLTLFNGQTATLTVNDLQFFVDQRAGALGERADRVHPEQQSVPGPVASPGRAR